MVRLIVDSGGKTVPSEQNDNTDTFLILLNTFANTLFDSAQKVQKARRRRFAMYEYMYAPFPIDAGSHHRSKDTKIKELG